MGVRYGQNFLRDQNILRKMVSHLESDQETLVEIGCGDGVLSEVLLDYCQTLHIIEIDDVCIEKTKLRLQEKADLEGKKLCFHHQDVLTLDLAGILLKPVCIVANVPYYISAKLIQWMVFQRSFIKKAFLMFQKEVVQKFVAKPGQNLYTSLSVYAQFYFRMSYLFTVSAQCFRPSPQVESAVMSLKRKDEIVDLDESLFFTFVRSCFWARRKTVKRALLSSPYLKLDDKVVEEPFFMSVQKRRAETISLEEFIVLFLNIKSFINAVS